MNLFYVVFLLIGKFVFSLCQNEKINQILPFTSLKIQNEDILFTLDNQRKDWHKLLSIDNVGTDALIKYSKQKYGENNCDNEVECYKYNLIKRFDEVFKEFQNKELDKYTPLEYESNEKKQIGIDVESTNEKYKMNEKFLDENLKESQKKQVGIFAGLGLKNIFQRNSSLSKVFLGNENNNSIGNLRKEIDRLKDKIVSLESIEKNVETKFENEIKDLNESYNKEKTIVDKLFKMYFFINVKGNNYFIGFSVYHCISTCYVLL